MIDERASFWSGNYDTIGDVRSAIQQHVGEEVVDFPCEGPGWYFGTFESDSALLEPTECVLLVTEWEDDYTNEAGSYRRFTVRAFEEDPRPLFLAVATLPAYGVPR